MLATCHLYLYFLYLWNVVTQYLSFQNSSCNHIGSITGTQKYDRKGKKWQRLTDGVMYCIEKDMLLVHTVKNSGFFHALYSEGYTHRFFPGRQKRKKDSRINIANLVFKPGVRRLQAGTHLVSYNHFHSAKV